MATTSPIGTEHDMDRRRRAAWRANMRDRIRSTPGADAELPAKLSMCFCDLHIVETPDGRMYLWPSYERHVCPALVKAGFATPLKAAPKPPPRVPKRDPQTTFDDTIKIPMTPALPGTLTPKAAPPSTPGLPATTSAKKRNIDYDALIRR